MRPGVRHSRLPLRALAFAAAVLVAGCAQPAGPAAPGGGPVRADGAPATAGDLPAGCSLDRVAVAHHANGTPAAWSGPRPVGCLMHTGVDSSEPTLGVASDGTVFHYPAAVIDRDTPAANGVRFLTGVARSTDEGASWRVLLPTAGPVAPTHQASTDPYFFLDPATDRIWADDLSAATCSVLSWSDDLGQTWMNSLNGCSEFDHQTLFTGPPVSSTTVGYPNILYRCSINAVMLSGASTATTCTKSLDGGLTDALTGQPPFVTDTSELPNFCDGAVGHGIADPHGTIYLPKGRCPNPWLAISKDEGNTWTRVQVAENGMPGSWETGFSHDAGVGVDPAGNVYYSWIAADRMPYLAVSRDGGATWSPPIAVAPPGLKEASLPALAVEGTGKVVLAYFGSYDSPGAPWDSAAYGNTSWHQVMTMSVDALAADPTFLTATANDPADPVARGECAIVRCNDAVKDFISAEVGPDGTPWVALVDGCLRECREGKQTGIDGREGALGRLWGGPSLRDS